MGAAQPENESHDSLPSRVGLLCVKAARMLERKQDARTQAKLEKPLKAWTVPGGKETANK